MKHITREFDLLDPIPAASRIVIDRASSAQLAEIYPRIAAALMQHMATLDTCQSILRRHNDNIWAIIDRREDRLIGLYAMAMLSPEGHAALLAGNFEAHDPRLSHVAALGEKVAGIYKWGVFAPGIAAAAIPLISERLRTPDYRNLDLFGNGSTPRGRKIMESVGFQKVANPRTPRLYRYERLANRTPLPRSLADFDL